MTSNSIAPDLLEKLSRLDSCSVANAIETFGVRLRNTGFADSTIHCMFEDYPPLAGYAATVRIRTTEPPMEGESYFYRLDWLDHVMSIPSPRVVVIEDMDHQRGLGALVGAMHANILRAVGCLGMVTDGAVRHLEAARALNFQMFARNLSVSHSYAHVYDFGGPVEIGQMKVSPGDLLHGDRHGIQTVPLEIAEKVPAVAQRMRAEEQEMMEFCRSEEFTVEKLRSKVEALKIKRRNLRD
jgi:4-hydroxy-4-methyl-2-oxoglutarate aldolase